MNRYKELSEVLDDIEAEMYSVRDSIEQLPYKINAEYEEEEKSGQVIDGIVEEIEQKLSEIKTRLQRAYLAEELKNFATLQGKAIMMYDGLAEYKKTFEITKASRGKKGMTLHRNGVDCRFVTPTELAD